MPSFFFIYLKVIDKMDLRRQKSFIELRVDSYLSCP